MKYSEKLFLLYILITIALVGFGLNKLLTSTKLLIDLNKLLIDRKIDDDTITIAIFFTTSFFLVITCLIFGSMKILFVRLEKSNKTGLLERINFNRSVGFFLIFVCGIVPRILSLFAPDNDIQAHYFLTTTCLSIAVIAHSLFVGRTSKYCTWDNTLSKKIAKWVVSTQVIILLISCFLIKQFCQDSERSSGYGKNIFYLHQIFFTGLTLVGVQEILDVLFGSLRLKEKYAKVKRESENERNATMQI